MTVKQCAAHLEISPSLVYALLISGRLKGTRHGLGRGTWRISEAQLGEYLDGPRDSGAGPPGAKAPAPSRPAGFKELDGERLLAAWRRRGAKPAPPGGRSSPTS